MDLRVRKIDYMDIWIAERKVISNWICFADVDACSKSEAIQKLKDLLCKELDNAE